MEIGDKIHLKNGCVAMITKFSLGDFVGDPRVVYYQYMKDGRIKQDVTTEDQLKERGE